MRTFQTTHGYIEADLSILRSKPYKKWLLQAKPQRDLNPTTRCWHSWLRSNKIKCGVNPPQINSQSTFIRLTPHFTVLDIWRGFGIDREKEPQATGRTHDSGTVVYGRYRRNR